MESEPSPTPQQVLDGILSSLRLGPPEAQLAALKELGALNYSSPAIVQAIEKLLLSKPGEEISATARAALASPTHRFIRRQASRLSRAQRNLLLDEIAQWETDGLIDDVLADVLEARYDLEQSAGTVPAPASPALLGAAAPAGMDQPAPASIAAPAAPAVRPTLAQALLSEASIRIALYLGAFLVIAAAAILAALVEAVRLPILAAVTVAFAAGSGVTRRRLPQPSFVLFIVFSCLIPFDAVVLRDTLVMGAGTVWLYWVGVCLLLALVWVFATWFFDSRFFSITAFAALDAAVGCLLAYLEPEAGTMIPLSFALAGLLALAGVFALQRLKDKAFARPLFITSIVHTVLVVLLLLISLFVFAFILSFEHQSAGLIDATWLAASLSWTLVALYFLWAFRLYEHTWLAWAASIVLLPLPWTFLKYLDPPAGIFLAGVAFWGALYAAASEALRNRKGGWLASFSMPLLASSYPALLFAWLYAGSQNISLEFGLALWVTLVFALLSWRKPLRVIVWSTALLSELAAFLIFFSLPFMEKLGLNAGYPIVAAAFLFLLPDLLLRPDLSDARSLRWPIRAIALMMSFLSVMVLAGRETFTHGQSAAIWLLFALAGLAYALRYRKSWIPYVFSVLLPLAVLEGLAHFHAPDWLPFIVGLAVAYYAAGVLLKNFLAQPLRYSGLALGGLAILFAAFAPRITGAGWYSLLVAALFALEMYRFRQPRVELGMHIFTSLGWWLILIQLKVHELSYSFAGISIIWILLAYLVDRTFSGKRPIQRAIHILSALLAAGTSIFLLFQEARVAAICFSALTLIFLLNSLLRRSPLLGYSAAAALPLAVFFLLRALDQDRWLFPLIALAIAYYAAGFVLRRSAPGTSVKRGWAQTLRFSGLALGAAVSLSAPFEHSGLQAAIPVALAALLWTAEAFEQRNVWLGFPSNALYLGSYFLLLSALKVEEPQFYSVGAAALGLLMHYLLCRAGSRKAAFLTGMLSQLVLLSTTYYQMVTTEKLGFFAVLFFQGLAVLAYGIVIRSRSLVITPIIFVVLGVITVIYSALKGISTVILIGCTGILLLLMGIFAVILRERFVHIGDRFSNWQA